MRSIIMSGNTVELDKKFSTTRRVIKKYQSADDRQDHSANNYTLLPGQLGRCGEGGLRTQGYLKSSELNKPLISIITVVYNGKEHLEQAILSVVDQAYDNVEYIIIDGGSTDGTLDIIKKYDDALDYWVSEPDNGVYDAMNKGIKLFQGDYVLFLGCDDRLHNVLHDVARFLDMPATSYYGNVILSNNKRAYGGRFYPLKLFIQNIPHQAILYSRYVFNEYKFDCKYITVADYALNLKIFSDVKYGLKYIPKIIADYNNEYGLSSTLVDHEFSKNKPEIIKKHYSKFYYKLYMMLRFIFKKRN
jgi:glycosyltransferase involved in cell wall biosynthesis